MSKAQSALLGPRPHPWPSGAGWILINCFILLITLQMAHATECWRQKLPGRPNFWYFNNHTIKCPMHFQWTVADFCCYETYDTFLKHPKCCYSEVYKLAVAVGFICLVLLGTSFCLFFCWFYNLPHHLLYIITFRKFRLNDWMAKARNGPYVDPSFYSGEPFWSRGAESHPYPLRPMPPRIFYPAPPANMKFRWDMNHGEMPLFVLASRQFHRNPYSARPHDRTPPSNQVPALPSASHNSNESRRSSITTLADHKDQSGTPNTSRKTSGTKKVNNSNSKEQRMAISSSAQYPPHHNSGVPSNQSTQNSSNNSSNNASQYSVPFIVNIDEEEAASELLEALRLMDEKDNANDNMSNGTTNTSSTISPNQNYPKTPQHDNYNENGRIFVTASSRDIQTSGSASNITRERSSSLTSVGLSSTLLGKVSLESLNQQLSSSLSLSIANLPNVQVIGNFGAGIGGNQMETILEDEDHPYDDDEDLDYNSPLESRPSSKKGGHDTPRISSALDRIVTRARQEIPFKPSLPGAIPENPEEQSSRANRLSRRNSAPVNC